MKKMCRGFLIMLLAAPLVAQDKSKLDIDGVGRGKNAAPILAAGDNTILTDPVAEATLLPGGYFTIGTVAGLSSSPLDDRCGITFGHPYALTSYPLLAIDGAWSRPDAYFSAANTTAPVKSGDTLALSLEKSGICRLVFTLVLRDSAKSAVLSLRLENLDGVAHTLGLGLVFDPALGKWGDGCACWPSTGAPVLRDTLLQQQQIPVVFELWERPRSARGLGVQLDFGSTRPDFLALANWREIYADDTPAFQRSDPPALYDLTMKIIWNPVTVGAGGACNYTVGVHLLPPEFSPIFMRCDLPAFLSLENNLLFPRQIPVTIEVANTTATPITDAGLALLLPEKITGVSANFPISVPAKGFAYQVRQLTSQEVLENSVVEVGLVCEQNGTVLDQLTRQVFIPTTPLSDTGLVVTIDTLITDRFPEISLLFTSAIEQTGQKLFGLRPENVFLYEDQERIRTFALARDTTGGVNAADIIFVLDVTGSMSNEIAAVRNNIIEFTDSLSLRGIDYRLAMVTFLDEMGEIFPFTDDVQAFQLIVGQQFAHGGGDLPENSLEALLRASMFDFRATARRMIVWITDASYHERDGVTSLDRQTVINALLANAITVHAIGSREFQTGFYDPIILPTGGNYYDINGNFRDILLDVSRLKSSGKLRLSYRSPLADRGSRQIDLEIHYAGRGGMASATYAPGGNSATAKLLSCYPNPFNPTTRITFRNPGKQEGEITIYNLLGQRIRNFTLNRGSTATEILWDARDTFGEPISTGFYFIQLRLLDQKGKVQTSATEKILYMK